MRLFFAVNFSKSVKEEIGVTVRAVKRLSEGGNFTRTENIHLTLVFLGEVETGLLPALKKTADQIKSEPFTLKTSGIGKFNKGGKSIYWLGVESSKELILLQENLFVRLSEQGFVSGQNKYTPHITLGRQVRAGEREDALIISQKPEITVRMDGVSLMLSESKDGVLTYTEIYKSTFDN